MKKLLTVFTAIVIALAQVECAAAFSAADVVTTKYSQAVEEKLFDTGSLEDYITPETPAFGKAKSKTALTEISERNEFVEGMADENGLMTVFYLDGDEKDVPVVFVTDEDLSACTSAAGAAKKLKKSEKVNVLIQAQIHGNEPGAGEGVLYLLQRLNDGEAGELTESMNIIAVPCANPNLSGRGDKIDANRDSLSVSSLYTMRIHNIFNKLMPEVFIDCHECLSNIEVYGRTQDYFTDVYTAGASTLNAPAATVKLSGVLSREAQKSCVSRGLRASEYDSNANSCISRVFYSLYGTASVLIETTGVNMGKSHYARRVFAHYEAISGILRYVKKNAESVKSSVEEARKEIVNAGREFDSDNRFVLEHRNESSGRTIVRSVYSASTAKKVSEEKYTYKQPSAAVRSRALPTAYIIPKKTEGADKAVKKLGYNGVKVYELPAGSEFKLSRFKGTSRKAVISSRQLTLFSGGAYVIPLDQEAAKVAAAMLEPDSGDTYGYNGSLVQCGILKASGIYRYTGKAKRIRALCG